MFLGFSNFLILGLIAAGTLVILFFILRRSQPRQPLQLLLETPQPTLDQQDVQTLLPLLLLENDFPAFSEILSLVLARFPLSRFLAQDEFRSALTEAQRHALQSGNPSLFVWAMCRIVQTFLEDPDVEFETRPHLSGLVDKFLNEVESYRVPAPPTGATQVPESRS